MKTFKQRRIRDRVPSRLKPAKLLSTGGEFLADCAITDRSGDGARVRIFGTATLPETVVLFDETQTLAWPATLAWGRGSEAGLKFMAGPKQVPRDIANRLSGRYYAVPER